MVRQVIEIDGKRFVLVDEAQLRRLERLAHRPLKRGELPPTPDPDEAGNRPALAFLRATIARDIVRERKSLGLTQEQLAEMAGIRQETLSRIESGRHAPTVRTVTKIDRALKRAKSLQQKRKSM